MATNYDVTLKRFNGTDWDKIFPATHLGQLYTDNTLATPLNTYLDQTFINVDQLGAAEGVATLDISGKVPYSQLPAAITGGLKYKSALTANTDLDTLGAIFSTQTDAQGSYWIATADIDLTSTAYSTVLAPGDEGDSSFPITIEAGDWVVLSGWAENAYVFAIVNNTYNNATDAAKGVVTLSSITTLTSASGNNVITDGILAGLIGTSTGSIAAGDHLHDGRYYTQSKINNFFSGAEGITGYNKTNWDTAYGWGDHAQEGYLTEEALADLTDVTLTNLAANNILRYTGTEWVNEADYVPVLFGTGLTSSITGALILDTTVTP